MRLPPSERHATKHRRNEAAQRGVRAISTQSVPRPRPPFERIALLLQGGGALGSYQAGVYQALAEANLHPDWVAGISIGAINSALIAGNPPEQRVEKLRAFWETITEPPLRHAPCSRASTSRATSQHQFVNQWRADGHHAVGRAGLLQAALPAADLHAGRQSREPQLLRHRAAQDAARTPGRLRPDQCQGNAASASAPSTSRPATSSTSTTTTHRSAPQHVIASGSLPPGFPATEIDGEFYWDGGVVSNTPLQWVLDARPRTRHARLPGRPVERARRAAARHDRGRRAPEGHPLLEPHARRHRPVPQDAGAAPRHRQAAGRHAARAAPDAGGRAAGRRRPTARSTTSST